MARVRWRLDHAQDREGFNPGYALIAQCQLTFARKQSLELCNARPAIRASAQFPPDLSDCTSFAACDGFTHDVVANLKASTDHRLGGVDGFLEPRRRRYPALIEDVCKEERGKLQRLVCGTHAEATTKLSVEKCAGAVGAPNEPVCYLRAIGKSAMGKVMPM